MRAINKRNLFPTGRVLPALEMRLCQERQWCEHDLPFRLKLVKACLLLSALLCT